MNDREIVYSAARLLLETAKRINTAAQMRKLVTPLQSKLKRLFAQQGRAYIRKFDKYQKEFREALSDDNIDALFDDTNVSVRMANAIEAAVENALTIGADDLLTQIGDFNPDISFNLKNPRAVAYLKNYGVDRVTQIDDTSKAVLRKLLMDGIDQGYSYSKMVVMLKAQFGAWSTSRAKLIATTEMGNAYQQGNLIVGLDLKDAGLVMQKSWLTVGDDKVDPACQANQDEGWIDVSDTHSSGVDCPLDHPGCRCVELYRRKPSE